MKIAPIGISPHYSHYPGTFACRPTTRLNASRRRTRSPVACDCACSSSGIAATRRVLENRCHVIDTSVRRFADAPGFALVSSHKFLLGGEVTDTGIRQRLAAILAADAAG